MVDEAPNDAARLGRPGVAPGVAPGLGQVGWGYRPPVATGFEVPTVTPNPHDRTGADNPAGRPAVQPAVQPASRPAGSDPEWISRPAISIPPPAPPTRLADNPEHFAPVMRAAFRPSLRRPKSPMPAAIKPSRIAVPIGAAVFVLLILPRLLATAVDGDSPDPRPRFTLPPNFSVGPAPTFNFSTTDETTPTDDFAEPGATARLDIGDTFKFDDMTVRLVAVDLDAAERIAAANQFNAPPPAGSQFVLLDLAVSNEAGEPRAIFSQVLVSVVGPDRSTFDPFFAGVVPQPLPFDEIGPGSAVTGQLAFTVPSNLTDDLTLQIVPYATYPENGAAWNLTP